MRFIFLANGLGEVVPAAAVARYAEKKGIRCRFLNATLTCQKYTEELGLDSILLNYESKKEDILKEVLRRIEEYKPGVIFCCNSKTTRDIFQPPKEDAIIVSLDSNWLFDDIPSYFNKLFVVFPAEIFFSNRNYSIKDKRVIPVGFIPSGYELDRSEMKFLRERITPSSEKLIFAYFGRDERFKEFLVEILLEALEDMNKEKLRVKATLISEKEVKREDIISIKWFKSDIYFNNYLAAVDCLITHHGMATLAKAILNKVPIIVFVPDINDKKATEVCEIEPFAELGLCISLTYSSKPEILRDVLEEVLFRGKGRKIQEEQAKYSIKGEEVVLSEIYKLIK